MVGLQVHVFLCGSLRLKMPFILYLSAWAACISCTLQYNSVLFSRVALCSPDLLQSEFAKSINLYNGDKNPPHIQGTFTWSLVHVKKNILLSGYLFLSYVYFMFTVYNVLPLIHSDPSTYPTIAAILKQQNEILFYCALDILHVGWLVVIATQ